MKPSFYQVLNSVALVLQKYKQTLVDVYGHTDSSGDDQYNFDLSQRRALAVANYLSAQGVDSRRFAVTGFGETKPIASNATRCRHGRRTGASKSSCRRCSKRKIEPDHRLDLAHQARNEKRPALRAVCI